MAIMRKRKRRSGPCIGVDLSDSRVKILEFDGKSDDMRVAGFASIPLPSNAVSEGQIINPDAVGKAIASAVRQSGSRNRSAAISVPNSTVITKTLTMPTGMSNDEIERQIEFKAPQLIPHPIQNVSLDHQVLGPDPENPKRNRVLLVACRKEDVDMRTAVLEIARLKPRLVDIEEYALRNACTLLSPQMPDNGKGKVVAVFEVGARQTRLNVLHDLETVHTTEIGFGGQVLAYELIDQHGLGNGEQLDIRLRSGQLKEEDIALSLDGFCDMAAVQVERALQFYFSAEPEAAEIDSILFTGGCAIYPGFAEQMQERLPWPATAADPIRGLRLSPQAQRNHAEHAGPALMAAAGLSMRAIMWRSST